MAVLKKSLLAVLYSLLCLQAIASPTTLAASAPIVDLGYAQYQGAVNTTTNTTSFLSIRYAAPPTGNLRWAAPQPPANVSGVQQATAQPNECHQASSGRSSTNPFITGTWKKRAVTESEDCLFLNVYTPGNTVTPVTSGGLPVLVWIHGGGYIAGAASSFNGADLIMDSNHGLIVVLIQYRLGLFGFLPGHAVMKGGALNAGLLDQNYALQWVQSNIASFGGDPTKVTIWGESAGAGSVLQHIVAHAGNTHPPLFRAAITSSTFLPSQYNHDDTIPEMVYSEVVATTGCSSSSDTLSCLRNTDVNTLETVNRKMNLAGFYGTYVFVPVVDGTFIVERPTVTMARGKLNGQALLAVTNENEGRNFVNQSLTMNISDYVSAVFPDLQPWQANLATELYGNLGTNVEQANYAMSESIFVCPTYYLLQSQAYTYAAWKGEFAVPPALHGNDQPYYFTSYGHGPAYNNSQFITSFSNGFMAFAMSMNPGETYNPTDVTPTWFDWDVEHTEMIFNVTETGTPNIYASSTDNTLIQRCLYWLSNAPYTAQ